MDGTLEVSQWLGPLLASCARTRGGWWARTSVPDALSRYTPNDDTYYRAHFAYFARTADTRGVPTFEEARPAYVMGHLAGIDPTLDDREWVDIEPALERAWAPEIYGEWAAASGYARAAFRRSASAEQRASRVREAQAESYPLRENAAANGRAR